MATYKVPQDVEAEDKLLGPLTFKQFIFLLIAAGGGLLSWGLFQVNPLLSLLPLPIVLGFGGLAIFRREDQPVERYLLSFFNFMIRPRQRLWIPEGIYDHLVITPEKKPAPPPLKQDINQVHGQLEKLAQVVDTRGWASKQPELTAPSGTTTQDDDRLFTPTQIPQDEEGPDEAVDVMDDASPQAQNLDTILQQQTTEQRQEAMDRMRQTIDQNAQPTVGTVKTNDQPQSAPPSSHEGVGDASASPQHNASAILDTISTDELSVSQLAAAANRQDDTLQEGEEIKLR